MLFHHLPLSDGIGSVINPVRCYILITYPRPFYHPNHSGAEGILGEVVSPIRKIARIAISRKRHFRSPKRKNENTLQYKVPPKTWENSPQKPILAIRKWFFGHCYVQKYFFLTRTPTKYLNSYIF